VLDCQKKRLCNVMDQIILRYENVFNFVVCVKLHYEKTKASLLHQATFLVPKRLCLQLQS